MVTFREAVADSLRGALCAVIAVNDDGAKLFGRIPGLSSGADYFNFFAPLRAQLCNDDPADVPVPPPPFTGGQCDGVCYEVTVTSDLTGNEVIQTRGPIGGVRGITLPGGGRLEILSRSAVNFTNSTTCFPLTTYEFRDTGLGGTAWAAEANPRIVSVAVKDGIVPDDCGDPPIVVPPPGPVTKPINVTYNNEDNDVIDIDGDVVFSPFFSVGDLSLNVPFNLDLGGLEFSGTIEISPDFNIDLAPRVFFGGPGRPDDPDLPPSGDPNTPDDPPTDDETTVIIGVVIRSSPVGELQSTAIATVNMPTIYAPRLASCSFAIESSLTVAWTSDIDVKNRDCYIPCPVPTGAVGVSVTPMPGWECSWTAVRGRPLT